MKKIALFMAVLILAVPAMAAVSLSGVGEDDGGTLKGTISYDKSGGALPRAFALDITVDAGLIVSVDTSGCEAYDIYMGTIQISGGVITDPGGPVAPSTDPDALGGLGTTGITVEMGSLYGPGGSAPADSGDLIIVTVSAPCTMTVVGNATRGNIVLEGDPVTSENPSQLQFDIPGICYTGPDVAEFNAVGKPDSWCYVRQCHGDTDDTESEYGPEPPPMMSKPKAWVTNEDIIVTLTGYLQDYNGNPATQPWISADFNHAENEYGPEPPPMMSKPKARVTNEDIVVLLTYYLQTVPTDCQTASPVVP